MKVGKYDWPQWGGSTSRNNTPDAKNIPDHWDVETGENIRWSMPLGSETYGNPVVANGKVLCRYKQRQRLRQTLSQLSRSWAVSSHSTKKPESFLAALQ